MKLVLVDPYAPLCAAWREQFAGLPDVEIVPGRHNRQHAEQPIEIVACPGLGTGFGQVAPEEAARQMALAYQHFLYPPQSVDWQYARQRQQEIGLGGDLGFRVM